MSQCQFSNCGCQFLIHSDRLPLLIVFEVQLLHVQLETELERRSLRHLEMLNKACFKKLLQCPTNGLGKIAKLKLG